jgi:hypothetical protein
VFERIRVFRAADVPAYMAARQRVGNGGAPRYAPPEMRIVAGLAFALAFAAACGAFSDADDPAVTSDGGAESGATDATRAADANGGGMDASTAADASCDAIAVDYDFGAFPLGVTSSADGGTIEVLDGALVATAANGGTSAIYTRIPLEPASIDFAYTFEVAKPDNYVQAGCQLLFDDGVSGYTTLFTNATSDGVYFDDVISIADDASLGSDAVVLFSWNVPAGRHRIEVAIPNVTVGSVAVHVRIDGAQLPTAFVASIPFSPKAIAIRCGLTYEFPATPSTKKVVVDDVHLRACAR